MRVGNIYIFYIKKKLNIVAHGHMYGWLGLHLAADQGRGHDPEKHQREAGADGATSERRRMLALPDRGERKCAEYLQILVRWFPRNHTCLACLTRSWWSFSAATLSAGIHLPLACWKWIWLWNATHWQSILSANFEFFILDSYTLIPESLIPLANCIGPITEKMCARIYYLRYVELRIVEAFFKMN